MSTRIEYLDITKGLAILFVVMGHVIAWEFVNHEELLINNDNIIIGWKLIYSFHMPLFMFCSGIFSPSFKKGIVYIAKKRFSSLIVPYITFGALLYLTHGKSYNYWSLLILYEFILYSVLVEYIIHALKLDNKCPYLIYFFTYLLLVFWGYDYSSIPLFDVNHLSLLPYFCIGKLYREYYSSVNKIINKYTATVSLLFFVILFYFTRIVGVHLPAQSVFGLLMPFSAIVVIIYISKFIVVKSNEFSCCLQLLGRNTLYIYLIHFFCYVNLGFIQSIYEVLADKGLFVTLLIIQLTSSFVISCLIIYINIIATNLLHKSKIVSLLFLGEKI